MPKWTDANIRSISSRLFSSQRYRVLLIQRWRIRKLGNKLELLRNAPGYTPYAFGRGSGDGIGEFPAALWAQMAICSALVFGITNDRATTCATRIRLKIRPLSNPVSHYDETALKTFKGNVFGMNSAMSAKCSLVLP